MITTAERTRLTTLAATTQRKLEAHFGLSEAPLIPVTWDLKGRGTLGQHVWTPAVGSDRLRFNVAYIELLGDVYDEIVVHEVCHAVTTMRWRAAGKPTEATWNRQGVRKLVLPPQWKSHGFRWREAMKAAGYAKPRRTFDTTAHGIENTVAPARRSSKRFTIYCGCGTHLVTRKVWMTADARRCRLCKCYCSTVSPTKAVR